MGVMDVSFRQRRDQRASSPKSMALTARDTAIIKVVSDYRVLRQDQIQALFFQSRSAAQRVLQRLYQHGYLDRQFLPVYKGRSPTLYRLARRGTLLLRREFGSEDIHPISKRHPLKTEFLAHTLGINDVRIAITRAAQVQGYELVRWIGESDLKADYDRVLIAVALGNEKRVSLIPDAYFTLKTPFGFAHCFLEYDRGTMTLTRFKSKILAYIAYYHTGAYQRRYQAKSMRVLTVTNSLKRLKNLKAATEAAGGKRPFWFALADGLDAQSVLGEPVWWVATEMQQQQRLIEIL